MGCVTAMESPLLRKPGVVAHTCDSGTLGYTGRRVTSESAIATVASLRPAGMSEAMSEVHKQGSVTRVKRDSCHTHTLQGGRGLTNTEKGQERVTVEWPRVEGCPSFKSLLAVLEHSDQKQLEGSRGSNLESETVTERKLFSGMLALASLAPSFRYILPQPRPICPGMALPTVGWAFLHQ